MSENKPKTSRFRNTKELALILNILVATLTLLDLLVPMFAFASSQFEAAELKNLEALSNIIANLSEIGAIFLVIPAFVLFIAWLFLVRVNCENLNIEGMRYKPHFCIWGMLIPIVNLILPYVIIQEIWKASSTTKFDSTGWKTERSSWILFFWWFFVVTSQMATRISQYMFFRDIPIPYGLEIFDAIFAAISGALTVVAVHIITNKQLLRKEGISRIRKSESSA